MATSGTFTGARGGDSNGPYLTLDWLRISEDIPNNRSLIRLTLKLNSSYPLFFSADKTGALHGTSFTYTSGFSNTGYVTLKTLDTWVNHDSDGGKSQAFAGTFNIAVTWNGSHLSNVTVSGTADITDIPRASDFTSATLSNTVVSVNTSNTIKYTLDRKSTSFSQDMTLKLGSKVIKSWNTSGTGSLSQSLSATEMNTIISSLPNATSGTLSLTMQTKSGSTLIGASKTINEGFSLNSAIVPSASDLSVSIFGTGRDKTISKYVQSISKVTASFTRSAGYGASISSSTITVKRQSDGGNSQTIASNSGTTVNPVTLSGTYIVTGEVKDSRGRTDTVSTTITIYTYSAPTISKFVVNRTSPTTTVSADLIATWSALGTDNPATIQVENIDNLGVTETLYSLVGSTAGSLNTTQTYLNQSDASSYAYFITVTDSFGKEATAATTIGTSFVELTIAKGLGVGIGKVHEQGALDVSGDVYIDGELYVTDLDVGGVTVSGNVDASGNVTGTLIHDEGYMLIHAYNATYGTGHARVLYDATNNWLHFWNQSSAAITLKAAAFSVSSDRKLKTNIIEYTESALDKVNATPVYQYNFKSDLEESDEIGKNKEVKRKYGLIVDEAPKEIVDGESVELYAMISLLWRAVQEQSVEIDALKAELYKK